MSGESRGKRHAKAAIRILFDTPTGLRWKELVKEVGEQFPGERATHWHFVSTLNKLYPELVYKPQRGVYRHTRFRRP